MNVVCGGYLRWPGWVAGCLCHWESRGQGEGVREVSIALCQMR